MKKGGALWKKKGKATKEFLFGTLDMGVLGEISVMIFPHDRPDKGEKEPDFTICLPTKE